MKLPMILMVGAVALTSACSSGARDVTASYTSSSKYAGWSCENLSEELNRVQSTAARISGKLEKDRKRDITKTTVSLILFWPAAFFIEGDDPVKQQQLSTLLGEANAINSARISACSK